MAELFAIVLAAGDRQPVWAAVTDAAHAEAVAVRMAVNLGNLNLLSGRDLAEHLTALNFDADDPDVRPRASCGCGHEIVWVDGQWEHDVAPSIWGNDHDIDEPPPTGPGRDHWDEQDGVNGSSYFEVALSKTRRPEDILGPYRGSDA